MSPETYLTPIDGNVGSIASEGDRDSPAKKIHLSWSKYGVPGDVLADGPARVY